jgi:hypothetical protein
MNGTCPFQNGNICGTNCALFVEKKKKCAIMAIAEDIDWIKLLGVGGSKKPEGKQ